jgi:hypothetical protein
MARTSAITCGYYRTSNSVTALPMIMRRISGVPRRGVLPVRGSLLRVRQLLHHRPGGARPGLRSSRDHWHDPESAGALHIGIDQFGTRLQPADGSTPGHGE